MCTAMQQHGVILCAVFFRKKIVVNDKKKNCISRECEIEYSLGDSFRTLYHPRSVAHYSDIVL